MTHHCSSKKPQHLLDTPSPKNQQIEFVFPSKYNLNHSIISSQNHTQSKGLLSLIRSKIKPCNWLPDFYSIPFATPQLPLLKSFGDFTNEIKISQGIDRPLPISSASSHVPLPLISLSPTKAYLPFFKTIKIIIHAVPSMPQILPSCPP